MKALENKPSVYARKRQKQKKHSKCAEDLQETQDSQMNQIIKSKMKLKLSQRNARRSGPQRAVILTIFCFCLVLRISPVHPALVDIEEVRPSINSPQPEPVADANEGPSTSSTSRPEQFTVIAPKYLRPQSDYHVLISLANSSVPATVDLQLIGARDSNREQVEAKSVLANSEETQTVKFQVGPDWPSAEYVLSVQARAIDQSWNFTDERKVIYRPKTFSAFVQTDKAIYKPGQLVQFRAIFLTPTLSPMSVKNEINVTIENPNKNIVKQWHYLSNYRGLLSLDMPLSDDPILGDYTIRLSARDQEFVKQFTVAEYVLPTFDVDIQLPPYATFNESDIVATVRATYTYGKPVRGHVTLTIQPLVRFRQIATRPLEQNQYRSRLGPDGRADFQVNIMKDLNQARDYFDYYEREVEFFALVEEDLTGRKYNKSSIIKMHETKVKIERLEDNSVSRSGDLKPGLKQTMRYKVAYQDDTPVEDQGQQVDLNYQVQGIEVASFRLRPQAGIIEHELLISPRVRSPRLEDLEIYPNRVDVSATYRGHKHFLNPLISRQSESSQYLQINLPQLDQSIVAQQRTRDRLALARMKPLARDSNSVSVNDELRVQVRSTEPMQQVTCQGLARGDIVWALSRNVQNKTEFEFEIKIDARMAPESRILCFHVRPQNKEIIADSREITVANGLVRNLLKLTPSRDEAKPGQEVEVGVFTKPNSLVGILALDQSVLLLKSGNDLSSDEIMNDLKSYGAPRGDGLFDTTTSGLFDSANVICMTNNRLFDGSWPLAGRPLANPNVVFRGTQEAVARSSIALDSLILDHAIQPAEFHLKKRADLDSIRVRSLFPETWLWENGTADAQGQIKFSARVPDTITSWQLSAFSLNEAHGLALSQGKTSVRVFRPFFVKLNLPYSIIRGETVAIQAVVFNYQTSGGGGGGSRRPTTAKVTMENKRGEFEFVETAANSIQDEKMSSRESESRLVQIPPNEGVSVSFLIRPTKIGPIDIKVLAQGEYAGDGVVRKLLVKPEGQTQFFNKAMLVRLQGPQSTWRQNVSINVPANAVPGSQKVFVSAIGDTLGAGLSNVDDLLRLPTGGGEQNMMRLVPNIVLLNYLQSTRRLRDVQRERAVRNIEVGYQRQLNYKRPDGSFSEFGRADANGSVWLTAYVLKALKQAKRHVTVDEQVLAGATRFLVNHAKPDGSFEEIGSLHDKELGSPGGTSPASDSTYLTAYALAALLERPQAEGGPETREVIERGLARLDQQVTSGADSLASHELAIVAYVLELAGGGHQEAANQAYERLWSRAIEQNGGEQVHWSDRKGAPTASGGDNDDDSAGTSNVFDSTGDDQGAPRSSGKLLAGQSQPPLKPILVRADQSAHLFAPDALDVETTAWALLVATKRNELERTLPIVRWLVSQQNSLGGFSSSQDTVLAIEALAAHAEATSNGATGRAPLSIDVEFVYPRGDSNNNNNRNSPSSSNQQSAASGQATSANRLRKTSIDQVLISQTNALVQQQTRLPDNITWVQIQATGVGTAVVQVSWQYNLLVSAERPAFYLNPMLDRSSTSNYLQLSICTFYKGPPGANKQQQQQQQSDLAVVEVELPSGYAADLEILAGLRRHKQIKRVDTRDAETRLLVYLAPVTRHEELCFTIPAHRSSKVANNKPVPVTIYDFHDRRQAARIFYEPRPASSCDICEPSSNGRACDEFCSEEGGGSSSSSSSGRPSGRLVSVHEEREQRLKEERARLEQRRAKLSEEEALEPRGQTDAGSNSTSGRSILPDAFKLLPLTSAFATLNEAAQSVRVN